VGDVSKDATCGRGEGQKLSCVKLLIRMCVTFVRFAHSLAGLSVIVFHIHNANI